LVDLRGADSAYPLAGKVELEGAASLAEALAVRDGLPGAAVEPALLDRLGLKIGDRFEAGPLTLVVRAVMIRQPDSVARGFVLGPRVVVRRDLLDPTGLLAPGLPSDQAARIAVRDGVDPVAAGKQLEKSFGEAGLGVRDRSNAAPGAKRLIDQLEYFLGFIGLASLVAGGLGVAGAVSAYLATREPSIAVLKALGADGALIRNTYLIQIGLLASLGVTLGLVIGAIVPLILGQIAGSELPIPALFAVYPLPLVKAGAFGLLAAAAFSLIPLARARATPPSALFRRALGVRPPFGLEMIGATLAGLGLAALAVATAPTPIAAAIMITGVAVAFVALWALGLLAAWLAGKLRGLARGPMRIGLANLAGPRSAARTATPAIGLGVALLACVVLIQSALLAQVRDVAPKSAPAVVFTEIPGDQAAAFDAEVFRAAGRLDADSYLRLPFATGRIIALNGQPVDINAIKPSERWAFDNDVNLSVLDAEPKDSGIVAGRWWPAGYTGPPQVALEVDLARGAGLKAGDTITLSVLGRDLQVTVAVLREVE
ncbi:MAG: oxidoreductase, partial [Caulobacter sp. 12-67-6]